jgi:hypothetical protein
MSGRDAGDWPKWATPLVARRGVRDHRVRRVAAAAAITRESKRRRFARNFTTAVLTAVVTSALQKPLLGPPSERVERERLGLLNQLPNALRPVRFASLHVRQIWNIGVTVLKRRAEKCVCDTPISMGGVS